MQVCIHTLMCRVALLKHSQHFNLQNMVQTNQLSTRKSPTWLHSTIYTSLYHHKLSVFVGTCCANCMCNGSNITSKLNAKCQPMDFIDYSAVFLPISLSEKKSYLKLKKRLLSLERKRDQAKENGMKQSQFSCCWASSKHVGTIKDRQYTIAQAIQTRLVNVEWSHLKISWRKWDYWSNLLWTEWNSSLIV